MNRIVIGCSAFLFSLSSHAYQQVGSTEFAARFNTQGVDTEVLQPHANNLCVLTSMSVEETDSGGEEATCRVRKSGSVWILEARLDRSSDADAECQALCFSF